MAESFEKSFLFFASADGYLLGGIGAAFAFGVIAHLYYFNSIQQSVVDCVLKFMMGAKPYAKRLRLCQSELAEDSA
jgi:hypothetical protein